jgi:hypothetical protein
VTELLSLKSDMQERDEVMTSDIDQLWQEQQDDVFNVVADIDPQSSRIEYAFKAGCVAVAAQWEEFDYERDNPKRLVEHTLALMVERDKANAEVDRLTRLVDTLSRGLARYQDEEDEVGGDDQVDHPYQRRGSWSHDDWCAVEGCTSKASAHRED